MIDPLADLKAEMSQTRTSVRAWMDAHPFKCAAIALAVGAVIGLVL